MSKLIYRRNFTDIWSACLEQMLISSLSSEAGNLYPVAHWIPHVGVYVHVVNFNGLLIYSTCTHPHTHTPLTHTRTKLVHQVKFLPNFEFHLKRIHYNQQIRCIEMWIQILLIKLDTCLLFTVHVCTLYIQIMKNTQSPWQVDIDQNCHKN